MTLSLGIVSAEYAVAHGTTSYTRRADAGRLPHFSRDVRAIS